MIVGLIPNAIGGLKNEVASRFDTLDTKYSSISILACATVISLTLASIWGAMIVSRIIDKSPSSFASLAIPYALLWAVVSILLIKNGLEIKKNTIK